MNKITQFTTGAGIYFFFIFKERSSLGVSMKHSHIFFLKKSPTIEHVNLHGKWHFLKLMAKLKYIDIEMCYAMY